jgi:hypothetical protein
MDNVQNCDSYINIPSSQTQRLGPHMFFLRTLVLRCSNFGRIRSGTLVSSYRIPSIKDRSKIKSKQQSGVQIKNCFSLVPTCLTNLSETRSLPVNIFLPFLVCYSELRRQEYKINSARGAETKEKVIIREYGVFRVKESPFSLPLLHVLLSSCFYRLV